MALPGHKVEFDGPNRRITVLPGYTQIDVPRDIYSSWKEWLQFDPINMSFPQALRTIGGDPVTGNLRAGDLYFLMNGWQIVVNEVVEVTGSLFHDDGIPPYVVNPGGGVISIVSHLVYTIEVGSGTASIDPQVIRDAMRLPPSVPAQSDSIDDQIERIRKITALIPASL